MSESPFIFRGKRNYVLGADVLDAVLFDFYGSSKTRDLDYLVKYPCKTQGYRLLERASATQLEEMRAMAQLRDENHNVLIMPAGNPVTERCDCTETGMATYFTYDRQNPEKPIVHVSQLLTETPFSRTCVAAFKYLLNTCVVLEPRQYLCARLRLKTTDISCFSIQFQRIFAKTFFEGSILIQGQPCGQIFFGGKTA